MQPMKFDEERFYYDAVDICLSGRVDQCLMLQLGNTGRPETKHRRANTTCNRSFQNKLSEIFLSCRSGYIQNNKKYSGSVAEAAKSRAKRHRMAKWCCRQGCTKKSRYGIAGSKVAQFCALDAEEGMVSVYSKNRKRCCRQDCNKQPSYGLEGSKVALFCAPHAEEGMVGIYKHNHRSCACQGCTKQPSYGIEGSNRAELCAPHAQEGMVYIYKGKRKRCCGQDCTKQPSYGLEGSKVAQFCAPHAEEGMVVIYKPIRRRCACEGCTKQPSYGIEGSKVAQYCALHAKEGMVCVYNNSRKRCYRQDCTKQPSYGLEGSKVAQFCAPHAEKGMVSIYKHNKRKICAGQGCTTQPSYDRAGSKVAKFCALHAEEGMVCVRKKTCNRQGCTKQPSYDTEDSKLAQLLFAPRNIEERMVYINSKKTMIYPRQGCSKGASNDGEDGSSTKMSSAGRAEVDMVYLNPRNEGPINSDGSGSNERGRSTIMFDGIANHGTAAEKRIHCAHPSLQREGVASGSRRQNSELARQTAATPVVLSRANPAAVVAVTAQEVPPAGLWCSQPAAGDEVKTEMVISRYKMWNIQKPYSR